MQISFIIPAFNEQDAIVETLENVNRFGPGREDNQLDVLVIDNGSTDQTVSLAESLGARVYVLPDVTIASLRNHGASKAKGEIFIFLDADTRLTPTWAENIDAIFGKLMDDPNIVTGSHVQPEQSNNWFLRYWFGSFAEEVNSVHIGSAHLIVTRPFFESIGGFDANLVTAEDYDFCQRAKQREAVIWNNKDIPVVHSDFPTSISQFARREMWHGEGDCSSLHKAIASKSIIASVVYCLLICCIILFLLLGYPVWFPLTALILLLLLSSFMKFRHSGIKAVLINALIFNVYFCARAATLIKTLFKTPAR